MILGEYLKNLEGKSTAVIGLGVSNAPLARLLLSAGIPVTARDRGSREKLGAFADELEALGAHLILGDGYLENLTEDVIFRTPGVHPDIPELRVAKERGAALTSEMEAFFEVCPCRIIAVTGSDGKTTTTTIISEILKAAGFTVHLGGNIGTPLLGRVTQMRSDDFAVVELSSFQLHGMICAPDIAVITNLSPNHLDIHPSMEDYSGAKKMIYKNQRPDGVLVINSACDLLKGYDTEAPGGVRYFNVPMEDECAYVDGDRIVIIYNSEKIDIMSTEEIKIPGSHNVENYMAAFLATIDFAASEIFRRVASQFEGVAHRLELVRELRSVKYINDSIASSPTRTAAGLRAIPTKPHLIAGGYDKHIPFDEFGIEICRSVKALYLVGDTAEAIKKAVVAATEYESEKLPIYMEATLESALVNAHKNAVEGDIVLMSPACASFDRFKNFEERGERFREIVMGLE